MSKYSNDVSVQFYFFFFNGLYNFSVFFYYLVFGCTVYFIAEIDYIKRGLWILTPGLKVWCKSNVATFKGIKSISYNSYKYTVMP